MIVKREMDWTVNDFKFQQQRWLGRADEVDSDLHGHYSYALKQAAMYGHFAHQANSAFVCAQNKYSVSQQG